MEEVAENCYSWNKRWSNGTPSTCGHFTMYPFIHFERAYVVMHYLHFHSYHTYPVAYIYFSGAMLAFLSTCCNSYRHISTYTTHIGGSCSCSYHCRNCDGEVVIYSRNGHLVFFSLDCFQWEKIGHFPDTRLKQRIHAIRARIAYINYTKMLRYLYP